MLGGIGHRGVEAERLRDFAADFPDGAFVVHDQEVQEISCFHLDRSGSAECGCGHEITFLGFRID